MWSPIKTQNNVLCIENVFYNAIQIKEFLAVMITFCEDEVLLWWGLVGMQSEIVLL